jgi:hypothetical protein
MQNNALLHRLVGVGVFLITLAMYLKTMAPTVSFWDCGEFIACSYIMGVPHPPGAPLYILLGRLFSLLPIYEVAWRVNLMSVLSSALAIWCAYLSTVALARRALGGSSLQAFGDNRDITVLLGGVVSALSLAFSYTFWYNAVEAEVYGYSIFFTALSVWLILYWEGTSHGQANDRWLLLIAYLFGLGGGIHLLCLLTVPTLLILVWFADARLRRLILLLLGVGVWAFLALAVLGPGKPSNIAIGLALLGLLAYMYQTDRRSCWLLLGVGLLFGLGYSTYGALYIRSGLNPAIDENDPETLVMFMKFLNREQYGTDSQLLGMLTARASRTYQFWDQQMKYFFQQFPFPLLRPTVEFRQATSNQPHFIDVSLVPYLLGLGGLLWHQRHDWQRFAAVMAMFIVMGFGLSMYLNMPDPQPRERHYVFGGMFFAFALWIGLGWTALVEYARSNVAQLRGPLLVGVACIGLLLPAGIAWELYHQQDRTGDRIAYDYAYNILESCEPQGILFTNGDNDTFPLWFLQEVEGIRRDVRVVNLSLLNTGWYIKQLRDREPQIALELTDNYIDSTLTDTQYVDLYQRLWQEPLASQVHSTLKKVGLDIEFTPQGGHELLRVQDMMILAILNWNAWKRPIYFALTVAGSNRLYLDPYLRMEGMVMRLVKERDLGPDSEKLAHNLFEVYRFSGLQDPDIYKDDNTTRLLGNYRACIMQLGEMQLDQGRNEEMIKTLEWGRARVPFAWDGFYMGSQILQEGGHIDLAAEYLEAAGLWLLEEYGRAPQADFETLNAIANLLVNSYKAYEHGAHIYQGLIAHEPGRWSLYHDLAATLQALDRTPEGITLLEDYLRDYGDQPKVVEALQILRNALNTDADLAEETAPADADVAEETAPAP